MGAKTKFFVIINGWTLLLLSVIGGMRLFEKMGTSTFLFFSIIIIGVAVICHISPSLKKFTPESCFEGIKFFLQVNAWLIFFGVPICLNSRYILAGQLMNDPYKIHMFIWIFLVYTSYRFALWQSHRWIFRNEPNPPQLQPFSRVIIIITALMMTDPLIHLIPKEFGDTEYWIKKNNSDFLAGSLQIFFVMLPLTGPAFFYLLLCRITGLDKKKTRHKIHIEEAPDRLV